MCISLSFSASSPSSNGRRSGAASDTQTQRNGLFRQNDSTAGMHVGRHYVKWESKERDEIKSQKRRWVKGRKTVKWNSCWVVSRNTHTHKHSSSVTRHVDPESTRKGREWCKYMHDHIPSQPYLPADPPPLPSGWHPLDESLVGAARRLLGCSTNYFNENISSPNSFELCSKYPLREDKIPLLKEFCWHFCFASQNGFWDNNTFVCVSGLLGWESLVLLRKKHPDACWGVRQLVGSAGARTEVQFLEEAGGNVREARHRRSLFAFYFPEEAETASSAKGRMSHRV